MATATMVESYSNFRELGVGLRRPGLLHIDFQRRWNIRTVYELLRALDLANADTTVQVVVLSGELSVGPHDPLLLEQGKVKRHRQLPITKETQAVSSDDAEDRYIHEKSANFVMRSLAKKMLVHRKLLVAFVEGRCLGLGLSVCSLCDLVYAKEAAVFLPALSHLDPCAEVGPFWTLPHIRWLLHLGEQADARTAFHCGLVASVLNESQEFWDRMDQYSCLPSAALMATKRLLLNHWRQSVLAELRQEGTPMAAQGRRLARSKL
ncbi:enoyl-CoA delta isomerase 2 [Drosophila kikkawai]|uniref:Enoyl-CoA delta isomerase 2 n=1 Tax=Drosophila kikkawai TaxID=30033 RepID=A0A6P4JJW9_DROKI|nr:chromodomain Y-like protein 2 [Drosophila kikkawai]